MEVCLHWTARIACGNIIVIGLEKIAILWRMIVVRLGEYARMSHCELCTKKAECGNNKVLDFKCERFEPVDGASNLRLLSAEVLKRRFTEKARESKVEDFKFSLDEVLSIIEQTPIDFDAVAAYQMMNYHSRVACALNGELAAWPYEVGIALYYSNIAEIHLFEDEYLRGVDDVVQSTLKTMEKING